MELSHAPQPLSPCARPRAQALQEEATTVRGPLARHS